MSAADLLSDMQVALAPSLGENAIQTAAPRLAELPVRLPVDHLSNSSLWLYIHCPEKWRRKYIEREYETPTGKMIAGSCTGAAERINFEQKIASGADLAEADVLDAFADEWQARASDASIDWEGERAANVRDSAHAALATYHRLVAPGVKPVSTERPFTVRFEGVEWTFDGYMDLEEQDGAVGDTKCSGRAKTKADADADLQPSSYLVAKRAEGAPAAEFRFHMMVRLKTPKAYVLPTQRTDAQLDAHIRRIFGVATEIAWRAEHDVWSGAVPGTWWCSPKCGFWESCPMGGLR